MPLSQNAAPLSYFNVALSKSLHSYAWIFQNIATTLQIAPLRKILLLLTLDGTIFPRDITMPFEENYMIFGLR